MTMCIDEINGGAAESITIPFAGTPLHRLVEAATAAQTWATRSGRGTRSQGTARRRHRDRGRLGDILTAQDELYGYTTNSSIQDQRKYLRCLAKQWNHGWILSQAVSALPFNADLDTIAESLDASEVGLSAAIINERDKRQHKGDASWWHSAATKCVTSLDKQLWIYDLLTAARSHAVVELADQLSRFAEALPPKHFHALHTCLSRTGQAPGASPQVLVDPIRLRQVTFNPQALWLIRGVASKPTIEFIDRRLTDEYTPLLKPGMGDMRPLLRIVGKTKTIKLETLDGCRATIPGGGWASDIKLGSISQRRAREILGSPGTWPSDIVQRASDIIATQIATANGPLAATATRDQWFRTQ